MEQPPILPGEVTVASGRLVLREWRRADAAALSAAINESLDHLRPWMPWVADEPQPLETRQAKITEWHDARLAGGDAVYAIWRIDGTVPLAVGGTGLHRRTPDRPDIVEIGYWVHAAHVRHGIAGDSAAALTDAAFEHGATVVEIHHDGANTASGAVPRRLGFRQRVVDPATTRVGPSCDVVWELDQRTWHRRSPEV